MPASPRRSERIPLRRDVRLVFHDHQGRSVQLPAETFSVNCHGAGIYTHTGVPVGSEVYLLDPDAAVGIWARVVSESAPEKGRPHALGVAFSRPSNYWGLRLLPPSWLAYARTGTQRPAGRSVLRAGLRSRRVRLRWRIRPNLLRKALELILRRMLRAAGGCRCCGSAERLVIRPRQEVLCNVCDGWM